MIYLHLCGRKRCGNAGATEWRESRVRIITYKKTLRSFWAGVRDRYQVLDAWLWYCESSQAFWGCCGCQKHPEDVKLGLLVLGMVPQATDNVQKFVCFHCLKHRSFIGALDITTQWKKLFSANKRPLLSTWEILHGNATKTSENHYLVPLFRKPLA